MNDRTEPVRASLADKPWFWAPIVPLVALDLWSKAAAFDYVRTHRTSAYLYGNEVPVWDSFISLHLVELSNTGTIWGLGQSLNLPLVILRCAALVLIVWFALRTPAAKRLQQQLLGLILSGAIGNLYDNFMMPDGGVRDFLLFFVGEGRDRWAFPAFNVADSCICVGAIGLALVLWRTDSAAARSSAPASAPPAG